MSGTTIISNFKEKFNPYKITKGGKTLLENYVLKHGETEEYWLNEWEKKKNSACFDGTAFHKFKEDSENYSLFLNHNFKDYPLRNFEREAAADPNRTYRDLPDGAYMELTLFNRRFMIAGQADKVVKDGLYIDIDDYKTNSNFTKMSFKHPKTGYKMMHYPAHNLMDCHVGHYTLQLNIYAWMLAQFGLIPRNLRILYYDLKEDDRKRLRNGEDMSYLSPEIIPVPVDMKLAEAVIRTNNVKIRKSTRSDMFLI